MKINIGDLIVHRVRGYGFVIKVWGESRITVYKIGEIYTNGWLLENCISIHKSNNLIRVMYA